MAGQLVALTSKPQIVTTTSYTMDGTSGVDVFGSTGQMTFLARIYSSGYASTLNVTIDIQTALTPSAIDADWVTIGTETVAVPSSASAPDGVAAKVDLTALPLRYVRWKYSTSTATTMVVEVTGVLW